MASVTDAEKALCSTNGKENFQRLTRLLMCGGVRLLRETFDSIHPPKDLPLKLGDPATRSQLKKAKLSRAEWSCLYPLTGTFGKSIEFDITLTFRLLRTICNLTPPVTGWDSLPSSADRSFEADLARIKFYRNSIYGHNHKMEVSDSDFCNLWKEISEALLRIANYHGPGKTDEWKKSIGKLLTDPLTSEAQSFVEELELWYKKDMEVKDQLQDQFQEVNEKLDLLITFELESFSRRGQPLAHLYSGPRSAGMTSLSIPEQQPQFAVAEATSGENQGGDQNPSEEPDIWKVILSFKESFRLLLDYLSSQLKLRILSYGSGSLSITAACSSLEILEGLWKDYCSGHLNTVAEKILFTSEVLKRLSLSEVKLRTIIKEEDYHKLKQCLVDEDQLKKAESCVHLSLRSDATNKSSVNVHYILIENITLIKGQDYRTSKLLTGEELERGTILQQDPRDKTRFVLADRQEVFFYESCFEGLDDKLKRLSDALAKMLLEIASLGERLQLFNRLVGRVSHFH
ncbi:uncharacterized protein LOC111331144 [Stylophora pistillata]|uniref:uncharacterized protein LOC111331144 n=1 Tax=Stylophora pistillata TaxID=50429 RepID=UPI000C041998|nr:uncharacterized protein LOC111331144 [Stylophora pistillata]